jgi:N-acetylglucosaminyl-diphospho-decaprenol L-rhamnosyltransferase
MTFSGSIVIVNFNSGGHLASCIDSIAGCAPAARVIVVDNASSDGSERVALSRDRLTIERNAQNLGFARAVNQGLSHADDELVVLLNPDCRLKPGVLELLRSELEEHPECAIVAPQAHDEDGAIQGNARGDPDMLTGLFGRSTLLTRLFPTSRLARRNVPCDVDGGNRSSREVNWVSGACMLARRDALRAVRGFDERYFLYWEDADLCRRLRDRGYTIRHVPSAHVVHVGGGSSRAASALALREFHRSAYTYYATHVARTPLERSAARTLLGLRCAWKLMYRP